MKTILELSEESSSSEDEMSYQIQKLYEKRGQFWLMKR